MREARSSQEAKAAMKRNSRASYMKLRDRHREKNLIRSYGVTLATYTAMLAEQGGVCAICGQPERRRSLCVDHDHETGLVRSLLCDDCNQGVGRFKDNPDLLRKAAAYMDRLSAREAVSCAS